MSSVSKNPVVDVELMNLAIQKHRNELGKEIDKLKKDQENFQQSMNIFIGQKTYKTEETILELSRRVDSLLQQIQHKAGDPVEEIPGEVTKLRGWFPQVENQFRQIEKEGSERKREIKTLCHRVEKQDQYIICLGDQIHRLSQENQSLRGAVQRLEQCMSFLTQGQQTLPVYVLSSPQPVRLVGGDYTQMNLRVGF